MYIYISYQQKGRNNRKQSRIFEKSLESLEWRFIESHSVLHFCVVWIIHNKRVFRQPWRKSQEIRRNTWAKTFKHGNYQWWCWWDAVPSTANQMQKFQEAISYVHGVIKMFSLWPHRLPARILLGNWWGAQPKTSAEGMFIKVKNWKQPKYPTGEGLLLNTNYAKPPNIRLLKII